MSVSAQAVAAQASADAPPVIHPRLLTLPDSPWRQPLLSLAAELDGSSVARDRQGGSAQREKDLIRRSGLLRLAIPRRLGGDERSWPEIYQCTRYLAAVDSSLAHLMAFHHLQVATVLLFGNERQHARWLRPTIDERWFWGNASNGRDTGLRLHRQDEHYQLCGSKSFCSGALGADALIVSAPRGPRVEDRVFLIVPAQRDGLLINDDWDGFGQRQTDSGTVNFDDVFVDAGDLLEHGAGSVRATLRTCLSQLILVQIYLGNAVGALNGALEYIQERSRGWPAAADGNPLEDSFIHLRLGDLWARLQAASGVADRAAVELQQLWQSETPSAPARGALATLIAEAKLLSARVALDITSQVFETMGARATSSRYGFDRFWRNVRVHTLHDPLDNKQRDIGRWLLTGEHPAPSIYS